MRIYILRFTYPRRVLEIRNLQVHNIVLFSTTCRNRYVKPLDSFLMAFAIEKMQNKYYNLY